MQKKLIKIISKVILPALLGIFTLYFIYRDFNFKLFIVSISSGINWYFMLLSFFFGVMAQVFRAWRWKILLKPIGAYPKTSSCTDAIFISYAASLVVPRIGEVSRCGVIKKTDGIPFAKSLGTVITERIVDMLTIAIISFITLITQMPVFMRYIEQTGAKIPSLSHLLTSPWFYIGVFSFIGIIILLYHLRKTIIFYEKVKGFIINISEGIYSLKDIQDIWKFVFYSFSIWACYFLHFYITFYCFNFTEHLTLEAGLVMFVVGTFAVLVPTPNGAGAWHFAIISALMIYGIDANNSSLFALVVHTFQTFLLVLLGSFAYARLHFRNQN